MRYLGQYFLKNKIFLEKIVEAIELEDNDFIIEIGPGHGELTDQLIKKNAKIKITAIEKDKKLTRFLEKKYKLDKKIEILEGDALNILPELVYSLTRNKIITYKIVGNIPYYITGYFFRLLADLKPQPKLIVCTVQKEVAQRIIAKNGMNLLAASIQFWAKPEIIDYIPKTAFSPQPKVDSAIIKLAPRPINDKLSASYYKLIKILFKQPKKTILNNLCEPNNLNKLAICKKLSELNINPHQRPKNLTISQIIKLSSVF